MQVSMKLFRWKKKMFLVTTSIRFNMKSKQEIITVCYASQKSNMNLQKSLFIFMVYVFIANYRRKLDERVILKFFNTKLNSFNFT